ncbi:MAG: hypothetical protein GFH27_549415n21 [Chloroflexi bacterium AL-W]|nr:hypothetical protein [Chloroflexi bacterium AL-N1]NOK71469.1 hypothetical protein [Chloroflexi bacterium AL-N10]NOK77250.1 hypothetical protein [Chloroflexi bacterium AL-N5]NOK86290.1 hypothetical protein [Chloroflexi bacterium AL-W]NOK93260.1 hypothetical protein [Chloroflexi bacterium AL-N15]
MIWKLVSRVLLICILAIASLTSVAAQTVSDEEPSARVIIAHLAPFADTVEGTSVSVLVNGEPALEEFVFGDATDYLELPAGEYRVDVVPTGATESAISGALTLVAGQDYTVAAIGDGSNQPLELLALEDDNSAPEEHRAKLRIVHTAPFAAELSDTAVDIRKENGRLFKGLAGVEYKQASPYLDIRARTFDLKITAPGGDPTLIDVPPVTFESGDIVTVFAIGDGVNQPTSVLSVVGTPRDGDGEEPARVTIAHLAPFADTVEDTSVSVLVNGEPALENFVFGDTTDFIELPADEYQVDVIPTGATESAISGALTLAAGQDYTVAAIGDGANQPLELLALEDDNSTAGPGNAKIRVVHAAPFAADLADTEVDLRTERGDVVGELTNVPYKVASSYLEVPVGLYDLKITTPGGEQTLIDIPPFIVFNNTVVTVFAIGDGANQPTGVTAITGGTPFLVFPANAH